MVGRDLLDKAARPLSVVVFSVALLIVSTESLGSRPAGAERIPAPSLAFEPTSKPDSDGPPTEVAVGVRMIDMMEIDGRRSDDDRRFHGRAQLDGPQARPSRRL